MYKHAPQFRNTGRDSPDPDELRDAAGIVPRGAPDFVRKVDLAVAKGRKETKNSSQLVRYLNSRNILNARGYPWTHAALQAFIWPYAKPKRSQSN